MAEVVAVVFPNVSVSGLSPCTVAGLVARHLFDSVLAIKVDDIVHRTTSALSSARANPTSFAVHNNTSTIHISASQVELT